MRSGATIRSRALAVVLCVVFAGLEKPADAKVPEEPKQLVISVYESEAAAREAMAAIKGARQLDLEGHALVVKEANGKVKFKERRAKGTRAGQAVAAVGGVMGARTGIGVGANLSSALGYLTSNVIGMQQPLIATLMGALDPGNAALVSAVAAQHGDATAKLQEPGSTSVLTYDLPGTVAVPEGVRAPSTPIAPAVDVPGSP